MRPDRPLGAAFAAVLALAMAAPAGGTLTNESIVRMTAQGMTPAEIIDAIRVAESTDFDLDPEIVTELRRAGVAEAVIEAMRAAQPAPPRPPSPAEAAPAPGALDLVFARGANPRRGDGTATIPALDPDGRPIRLAFFLICTRPTHAPDMWHTHTPFTDGFPRHHLIWMFDQTRERTGRRKVRWIDLDLPERAAVSLPAGDHQIEAGLAARFGDDAWVPLASSTTRLLIGPGEPARIRIRVRTRTGSISPFSEGHPPAYSCEILEVDPAPPT